MDLDLQDLGWLSLLAVAAVVVLLAQGCAGTDVRVERAHHAVSVMEHIVYWADDELTSRIMSSPQEDWGRYVPAVIALNAAKSSVESAYYSVEMSEAYGDDNVGRTLACAAGAVGELLAALREIGIFQDRMAALAWSSYMGSIGGSLCDAGDPDAELGYGEAL